MITGQLSVETPVAVPVDVVWDVWGGLKLGQYADRLLPDVVGRVECLQGDGGVGTVLKVTNPKTMSFVEKFTIIDNEKRIKETTFIEGGLLDYGYHSYKFYLEIIEKDAESCIVRSSVKYEVPEEHADKVSLASPSILEAMAITIGKHLEDERKAKKLNNNHA